MSDQMNSFEEGLRATKSHLWGRLGRALMGKQQIDEELLDEIEETLICADLGLETTQRLMASLGERIKKDKYFGKENLFEQLKAEMCRLLPSAPSSASFAANPEGSPYTILLVGVNGVGKTTTAARLAYLYQQQGASVILGAADTFRAAAISQLQSWGHRLEIPVVAKEMGSDPGAVAYATLTEATRTQTQVAIIDTAGRLHNKKHLMEELSKIRRVMGKALAGAPQEVLLVLDATTGQNAFVQAEGFVSATQVTGLVLTKLDGSARGGVLLGVSAQYALPVRYIGLGEKLRDLKAFEPSAYIEAIFEKT